MISAPEKSAHNLVVEIGDIGYISMHELPNYYDMETGFKRDKASEGSLIF